MVCHLNFEGEDKHQTFIAGCTYGSRESEIVHHKIIENDDFEERISKITELGLAYKPQALLSLFEGIDVDIQVLAEKQA